MKFTPAFNPSLCAILGAEPLEFDGKNNGLLQQHTEYGGSFMKYLEEKGTYVDVPLEFIVALMKKIILIYLRPLVA